jgi:SAM-dependent methyltransferase
MNCNVCGESLGLPIYESDSEQSLTSLCELRAVRARVWSCPACSHLQSARMPDQTGYYASEYRISLGAEDEDQIYEVHGERIVYRTQHQVDTLLARLDLPEGAVMLDYGCAKAAGPQLILDRRPDLKMHLFDVSDMYREHWKRIVPVERTAVDATPDDWQGRFDVVTSFFAIEHMDQPGEVIAKVAKLLKSGGVLYGIVPDTFGNVADFVVTDHVNHFTASSLSRLLTRCGFGDLTIGSTLHRGALVFTAKKDGAAPDRHSMDSAELRERSRGLAAYWTALGTRLRQAEERMDDGGAAIYGAGFYGSWIASALAKPNHVRCFLDRSPFQQGKLHFGKPVLSPNELPGDVKMIFVGLNPSIARKALSQSPFAGDREVEWVFLDGADA